MNIYSKIFPNLLLHIIVRADEVTERTNVIPENNFLQLAIMKMSKGKTFHPHKHKEKDGYPIVIAQESWIVLKGSVKCILYDMDETIIATPTLKEHDCSITLRGGHNYLILEDDTIVYEFKTGPYQGIEKDKEFINENHSYNI